MRIHMYRDNTKNGGPWWLKEGRGVVYKLRARFFIFSKYESKIRENFFFFLRGDGGMCLKWRFPITMQIWVHRRCIHREFLEPVHVQLQVVCPIKTHTHDKTRAVG